MAAKLKQAVAKAVEKKQPIIGLDLNAAQATIAARRVKAKSKAGRVIVKDGVDFEELGIQTADLFLDCEKDVADARRELEQQARVTRGTVWLAAASSCSDSDQIKTMVESFKARCEERGHKRAASDASDFKCFCLAYLKSKDEVIGVLADSPNYHDAMKELRSIKNDGVVKARGAGGSATLSDKSFSKVIEQVARMNPEQLTKLHKAGVSRANVLRKKGEVFEAFAK